MKKLFSALIFSLFCLILMPVQTMAQEYLTLEQCRMMALDGNKELEQARMKMKMADYDKKTAIAYYFPSVSANAGYAYNSRNIALASSDAQNVISNMGTIAQGQLNGSVQQIMTAIMSNPAAAQEYMKSPMWQTVMGALSQTDVSQALNTIGSHITDAFNLNIQNVFIGAVTVEQPIFTGGKILATNKIAALAKDLQQAEYEGKYQDILVNVEQAYWQIVSIAAKKRMTESYVGLLETMLHDAEISVAEGVAVEGDILAIKVKHNEANMMLTKATHGLALSKMLLCKEIGLPLDTEITLADENRDDMTQPKLIKAKSLDEICAARPETRSLDIATRIYDQKVRVARSDMMPKIAATANYLLSNPSCFNGFSNKFGGMFNVGVMVSIPIFHGAEALHKTRKAQTEAKLYRSRYDDARNLINLQVEQLSHQQDEAAEKFVMTASNLRSAEENLRTAMIGFEEGVVSSNVALAAQTAWLKAQSEHIDAGIEMQMNHVNLLKAQGSLSVNE